jgi:radical SAM protein with 4Fe4S-binding SPASM domain
MMETISARIDNVTGIPPSHRAEVIPPPRSVKVELTSRCNFVCSFCVKSLLPTNDDMKREDFSRWMRELHDYGVVEAGLFFLGESMLCPWLDEAVAECKAIGFDYVFLTTNGAACTEKKLEGIMAAGLDSLKFSLNFYDRQQLQTIAQVSPKNWGKSINAVKLAAKVKERGGYKTNIYASSIDFDGEQGERMKAVIDEIRPYTTETYRLPLYGMSGASKAHGFKPGPGNPGRVGALRDPLPCWSLFRETRIRTNGDVAMCCFGQGVQGDLIAGNLNEHSFAEIWNNQKFQELRAAHLRKDVTGTPCETCAAA